MYQQLTIVGNVGRDPELTYTSSQIPVCKFTVAVNKPGKKLPDGSYEDRPPIWFRVTIWRERGETAARLIKKGTKVLLVGEIDLNVYTDKDGKAAGTLEMTANEFKLLDSRNANDSMGGGGQSESSDEPNYGYGGSSGGNRNNNNYDGGGRAAAPAQQAAPKAASGRKQSAPPPEDNGDEIPF